MFYNIGEVSNRDIQLLYQYRILREPSDMLTAICRDSTPIIYHEIEWLKSDRQLDTYSEIYVAEFNLGDIGEEIPFLEFHPTDDVDWKWIADFIDIEVEGSLLKLFSASNQLSLLDISIYKCISLRHIDSMLTDILNSINQLAADYDELELLMQTIKSSGGLNRPDGLIPNLVKIQNNDANTQIVDSLYRIKTPDSNRLFVNYSQDNLNHMEHIFNQQVEFRFLETSHYVLDNFTAPIVLVSGSGDLVLRNIRAQVLVTDWTGTITIINCNDVHLTANSRNTRCVLSRLQIDRNSVVYLENQVHQIGELTIAANSICRHWRANVRNLSYVGPGCTYWACNKVSIPGKVQLNNYQDSSNTIFNFSLSDILGILVSDFNRILIIGQKNLTEQLGNSDAALPPSIYVPRWSAEYNANNGGRA